MTPAIVLFDVDGTLLITGGASSRSIKRACAAVLGDRFTWGKLTVGTLDPQLFMELAGQCGIDDAERYLSAYRQRYLKELADELARVKDDVTLMPGIRELLGKLAGRDDVVIGLLTGNWRQAVELKLAAAELSIDLFQVNAFAEDGRVRADLVPAALAQYEKQSGKQASPRQVILVGDTPRDVECAHQAGCRVLAVATGHYRLNELQACGPDAGVNDLSDPAALEELISRVLQEE